MTRIFLACGLFVGISLGALGGLRAEEKENGPSEEAKKAAAALWKSDLQTGMKLARESGKPLFVTFRCER